MRATMSISTMDAISWLRGSIVDPLHGRQIFLEKRFFLEKRLGISIPQALIIQFYFLSIRFAANPAAWLVRQ
jgi:hypothetical protein